MRFYRAPIPITQGRFFRNAAPASRWARVSRGSSIAPRHPKMRFFRALGTPSKLGLKNIALGRPGASKTFPRWVPNWTLKHLVLEAQVGIHLGGWVGAPGHRRTFFWRPKLPPQNHPPPKKKSDFSNDSYPGGQSFFRRCAPSGGQLGPPKNCSAAPWGSKTPSKWRPT